MKGCYGEFIDGTELKAVVKKVRKEEKKNFNLIEKCRHHFMYNWVKVWAALEKLKLWKFLAYQTEYELRYVYYVMIWSVITRYTY